MGGEIKIESTRFIPLTRILGFIRSSKVSGILSIEGGGHESKIYFISGLPLSHVGDEDFTLKVLENKVDAKLIFNQRETVEMCAQVKASMENITSDVDLSLVDTRRMLDLLRREPGIHLFMVDGNLIVTLRDTILLCSIGGEEVKVKNVDRALRGMTGKLTILRSRNKLVYRIIAETLKERMGLLPLFRVEF